MSELTSQSRGGLYVDFGDGRGAVHENDMSKKDRKKAGLPEVPQPTSNEEKEIGNG